MPHMSERAPARRLGERQEPAREERHAFATATDRELLDGLRRSSEPHFTELYDRYFHRIYSFVYRRMRNHPDTEEVVQETFMVVFSSADSFRGQSSLLSWIYGIAKNTLNNKLRRAQSQRAGMDQMERMELESRVQMRSLSNCTPEEHLGMRRYSDAIREQLDAMSEWQTQVFAMRHFENLSIREISERTDRSSDSIRSSLYRVKRLLVGTAEQTSGPLP